MAEALSGQGKSAGLPVGLYWRFFENSIIVNWPSQQLYWTNGEGRLEDELL